MYGLTVAGFALWLAYGVMLGPLIATNSICFVLAAFILVMKLLPASGKRAVADTLDPFAAFANAELYEFLEAGT